MKQLSNFEKMRLNTQRRKEVKKFKIQSEIEAESFRVKMEMLGRIQARQEETITDLMRNDPNANPYVDGKRVFNWWPFRA